MCWIEGFFNPTHHGRVVKTQSNRTHHRFPTQPKPCGSGWTHGLSILKKIIFKRQVLEQQIYKITNTNNRFTNQT